MTGMSRHGGRAPSRRYVWGAWVTAPILLLSALTACSGPASLHASITVSPASSSLYQAVRIEVHGLPAGSLATVGLSSTDAMQVTWRSSASYRVPGDGVLDLDHARALSGGYRGVSGMGLMTAMRPAGPGAGDFYDWNGPESFTVTVTVNGERAGGTTFLRRLLANGVTVQPVASPFEGYFYSPPASGRRPAVLMIGGSEGGYAALPGAAALADAGFPALSMAYFGEPGLPRTLSRIPLEYFAKALRWLARQPGVDPSRIAVLGASRGSEAAQLLGVHYPSLVHAVIALTPADAAHPSYPSGTGPAWTLHGRALPYTPELGPAPSDVPAAVFPDQLIHDPVFLDCGGEDQVGTSCPNAMAIMSRLNAHHDPWWHHLYDYPAAGHLVNAFVPYWPSAGIPDEDPDVAADEAARIAQWPHLLSFLQGLAGSPAR